MVPCHDHKGQKMKGADVAAFQMAEHIPGGGVGFYRSHVDMREP